MPWARLGRSSVPVLCYHNLGGNGVPRAAFEAQMRWLAGRARALTLDGLSRFVGGEPLDVPGVLITFDDGFRDLHTFAAPLLESLGLSGVVFVINDRLRPDDEPGQEGEIIAHQAHQAFVEQSDRSAWCSARELAAWADRGVLEIGGHTAHHAMGPVSEPKHPDLPPHWAHLPWELEWISEAGEPVRMLPELAPEMAAPLWIEEQGRLETEAEFAARVESELAASRTDLEAAVGRPVTALAWPWGAWRPAGLQAATRAGYKLAFTLERGPLGKGAKRMRLPRLEVRKRKGLGWFRSRMAIHSHRFLAALYSGIRL